MLEYERPRTGRTICRDLSFLAGLCAASGNLPEAQMLVDQIEVTIAYGAVVMPERAEGN